MTGESKDFKSMSHQYFYENYCLIDGKKPPPLSEFDKQVLAAYDTLKDNEQLFVFKSRGSHRWLAKIAQDKAIKAAQSREQERQKYGI